LHGVYTNVTDYIDMLKDLGPRPYYEAKNIEPETRSLYEESLVWDMTLPWVEGYADEEVTLPRFKSAGIDLVSLTVNDFPGSIRGTTNQISWVKSQTKKHGSMRLISNADDIVAAKESGELALTLNLQETNPLERSLDMVQIYYDLGVRHMLLAYNQKNFVGDGCAENTNAGLSLFGRRLIKEMNMVGMMVDGTHSGRRTTLEAMQLTEKPFIFSHCCAVGVAKHYRNISDEQIRACADTGGVIGVNGVGGFLIDQEARTEFIFRHLDYMVELVGPEHLGIGLDYVKNTPSFWSSARDNPDAWPQNQNQPHVDQENAQPEQLLELTQLMIDHGYSKTNIKGILGENFMRIAREIWL